VLEIHRKRWPLHQAICDVSKKIVGSVLVDVHELSANRLLPQAQAFYAEYNQKQTEHANVAI
jgi:hypothetical protein